MRLTEPGRILVTIPSWVGDVVMATPALAALRRRFPTARLVHLLRPYVQGVLEGLGFADEVIHWPSANPQPGQPIGSRGLVQRLRRERFDLAVLLTNSFRSALVTCLGGVRHRLGYRRDGRSLLLTNHLDPPRDGRRFVPVPALDYYNALARLAGCAEPGDRLVLATSPADEAAIDQRLSPTSRNRPLIALNPGANYGSAKCWPPEYYARLADTLTDRYHARVVASLGPKEREIADRLRAAAQRPLDVFIDPPLGLGPLKALVRRSRLLVTNDTGPRHFAAAFGVPVVTVFGSSDPAWTDTRFTLERNVMLNLDCQPCMERTCPLKHHHCMMQLTPAVVLEKVEGLLAETTIRPLSINSPCS